ncbi:MAG: radical SAM protein, partial [Clostridia bacterium]|nr:radical SAM protein [Clostridia bacterium]
AARPESVLRLRLYSIEPVAITEEFLKRCKALPSFCPHFHLSLQSGCDKILDAMNRRYTTEEYFKKVKLIREFFPDAGITTDIIAGFPGETESDFEETLAFAEKCGFSKIHAFPYSPREGTKAAKLSGLPQKSVRNERAKRLISLSEKLTEKFIKEQTGKTRPVYIERIETGKAFGYTDNYLYVSIPSENLSVGDVTEITLSPSHITANENEM